MTDRRIRVVNGSTAEGARVVAALDNVAVRVVLPEGEPHWRHQVLALALVDLLGRLFPAIEIAVDAAAQAHAALPPGEAMLVERLETARARGGLTRAGSGDSPLTIAIGPVSKPADLYLDGAEWISYVGTTPSRLSSIGAEPTTPIGPLCAAARGAAHAFGSLLAEIRPSAPPPASAYASALTYNAGPEPLNDPETNQSADVDALLVGAGSVGGAAVYALTHHPEASGSFTVVDPQRLEDDNIDRAILADAAAAAAQHPKVNVVKDALAHHSRLVVRAEEMNVTQYHGTRPREAMFPLVLSAVDSAAARRSIQDCLPLDLVNAACHPHEITVSGHRTGDGPCVCCLHMAQTLDSETIRTRVIARETGLNERMVIEYLVQNVTLDAVHLRHIEAHRKLSPGALDHFADRTLDNLWRDHLLYGESKVSTEGGTFAVAAPFVTALAGFLLGGECLKHSIQDLSCYALGREGNVTRYAESPYSSPLYAQLTNPPRWSGSECLCRSPRRLRLIAARYRVEVS